MSGQAETSIRPRAPHGADLGRLRERFALAFADGADGLVDAAEREVRGVTLDSRDVRAGDLYAALPGERRHGAEFAAQARERGAAAILTDPAGAELLREAGTGLPVLVSEDPRGILGEVSAEIYGTAGIDAAVFGVTGTNGKTSVVYLLAELLRAAGLRAGLSSTAERRVGDTAMTSGLTSPEAPELHALLARMREERAEAIALEVSAHAVVRHRIDGVRFDVVAFNNFSQDHLDDFGDMESYFQAKLALFAPEHARRGVVVVDSAHGRRVARESRIPVTTLATEYGAEADWHLAVTAQDIDGVAFALQGPGGARFRGRVPVFGRFMAENAALALIMLHEAGIGFERIAAGLEGTDRQGGLIPVYIPGRLEAINPSGSGPRFYVDYGHTPGSFAAMLDALAEVAEGRVIFMFGADGDRDTSKRAEMGRIAATGSDILIVCDYHPRSEDPAAIRAQLLAGARAAGRAELYEEGDPRAAVRLAISLARPGDVILYAGPGHEDYQEVEGRKLPYSARDEVRAALREAGLL
ncbi:UDP-N-acetylmuramoyl-L-alanyl-D-glutamate--2,6-diaminopimelate ligase [Leucobacter weissii]|uniref:UDP-N-acetylmuramyl-tripeptide synthetase n=1 Tax=Leucobacter weissii TaxID=1983706 RepID=A0A939MK23_9MICO|nr:UDP-N-acetylmuramoyl-L-alanyl-D-glutamate--2,6-diaminopimelate ligase [Leucobacter weissii]MBO1902011.1 UDP-N-acetylmuramoyl-L-alanyl-D-glutamate--2,6-diaminopimelate ligase [Leucobacter weissii]